MKKNAIYCDRCGKEVHPRGLFNLKGRCFKTVIEQSVKHYTDTYWTFPVEKTYDLCYECNIELRKFLGADERTRIPHVNYRPNNDRVFYLCDRKACETCVDSCNHTSDISHAVNFEIVGDAFFEISPTIDPSLTDINEGDDI